MSVEFKGRDLSGSIFGRLLVLRLSHKNAHNMAVWECQCSCPDRTIRLVTAGNLKRGNTTSCGCVHRETISNIRLSVGVNNRLEMIGQTYGRLTVLEVFKVENSFTYYNCRCACGNIGIVAGRSLISGDTRSCGCLAREVSTTHGLTHHPLYITWNNMKGRCYNSNDSHFEYYGGREENPITVCPEWLYDFQTFYDWSMCNGYAPGLTIERNNNDGPYAPWNCRWATKTEQARNKRNNVISGMEMANNIRSDTRPYRQIAEHYDTTLAAVKSVKRNKSWRED